MPDDGGMSMSAPSDRAASPGEPSHRPSQPRAYLDHAATTALRPAARDAYLEACGVLGNPGSVHTAGRRARAVLDDALSQIAEDLGVPRHWVVLTSGGTEADNLALRGVIGARSRTGAQRPALAVTATDHPAVRDTAAVLGTGDATDGVRVHEMPVDASGLLTDQGITAALAEGDTALVSTALVNNETGVVQDVARLARAAHEAGALVHTDAVQGIGHTALPSWDDVDLLSLTAHKIGGPVGIGALVVKPEIELQAVATGGGQQRGLRSGTLDAAHTAAFAAALHETLADWQREMERLSGLTTRMRAGIAAIDPSARPTIRDESVLAGHVLHMLFPGADSESLLFLLDERGVDASAGSACHAGVTRPSHVLTAMGISDDDARGSLRLSLGWTSTEQDVDILLAALPEALERSRAVAAFSRRPH